MRPLLDIFLAIYKDRQDFKGRVELEHVGAPPSLQPGDANAGL